MGLFGELCFPLGRFVPLNVPSSMSDPNTKQTAYEVIDEGIADIG